MRRVCIGGKWGAVDSGGNWIVPCQYEEFEKFHYGTAWVKQNGKWGLLNKSGMLTMPCEYEERNKAAAQTYFWIRKNGKWGMVLRAGGSCKCGEEIIPCEYEETGKFLWYLAEVKKEKWGMVNTDGKLVIPCEYDEIHHWLRHVACVRKGDRWGLADGSCGKILLPCEYAFIGYPCHGFFRVKKDGKWGYADKTGKIVIPVEYEYALDFSHPWRPLRNLYARVKKDGLWGVIDHTGWEVVPCRYDMVEFGYGIESAGDFQAWKDGICSVGSGRELRAQCQQDS